MHVLRALPVVAVLVSLLALNLRGEPDGCNYKMFQGLRDHFVHGWPIYFMLRESPRPEFVYLQNENAWMINDSHIGRWFLNGDGVFTVGWAVLLFDCIVWTLALGAGTWFAYGNCRYRVIHVVCGVGTSAVIVWMYLRAGRVFTAVIGIPSFIAVSIVVVALIQRVLRSQICRRAFHMKTPRLVEPDSELSRGKPPPGGRAIRR